VGTTTGRAARIPLIIGTNGEEGSLLGPDARTEGLFPKLSKDDQAQLAKLYDGFRLPPCRARPGGRSRSRPAAVSARRSATHRANVMSREVKAR
jgi:hypothetical protein